MFGCSSAGPSSYGPGLPGIADVEGRNAIRVRGGKECWSYINLKNVPTAPKSD